MFLKGHFGGRGVDELEGNQEVLAGIQDLIKKRVLINGVTMGKREKINKEKTNNPIQR